MYLFEYQAKDLMRQWGIPVLPGSVAITEVQAREVAQELGSGPWAVKAQIYAGVALKAVLMMRLALEEFAFRTHWTMLLAPPLRCWAQPWSPLRRGPLVNASARYTLNPK